MIDVVNTPERDNPVRVISTTPRERWEGHWVRGRKYPLYAVVENNGSKFMSLTGKEKEEPYVLYDDVNETFSANEGWVIKEMSADSRLTAIGGNVAAGLASVTASVDGEGASVLVTVGGTSGAKTIDFAFSGLKGKQGDRGEVGVTEVHATVDAVHGTPRVSTFFDEGVLSFAFTGLKGMQGNPGVNNATMIVADEWPIEASEATSQKIYLVYNSQTGVYDRYFTQFDGTRYDWVQAGSMTVNLEEYQRKDDEVWLTREEFDALAIKDITKVYNVYEEYDEP